MDSTSAHTADAYCGVPSKQVKQVWEASLRARFYAPNPDSIKRLTKTELHRDIVAAILEGALRLLPPDNSEAGLAARLLQEANKRARSLAAESSFVAAVQIAIPTCLGEAAQRQRYQAILKTGEIPDIVLTPDILFTTTVLLGGRQCNWLEYKNDFGFKKSPFVFQKSKKQFRKYADNLGSGMVVYRLGFEEGLASLQGVAFAREAEVLQWLGETTDHGSSNGSPP